MSYIDKLYNLKSTNLTAKEHLLNLRIKNICTSKQMPNLPVNIIIIG